MTSINDILKQLRESATDEADKGAKFERLMKSYLTTDVSWSDRFSNVWLWSEWLGHGNKHDTGIDLVAEERETGGLTAIQCKFYASNHTLSKGDIDSFFTASGKEGFTHRLIVSTTDNWSKNAEEALADQQIPVTRLRVQDLDESSIDWDQFSLKTPDVLPRLAKKELREHQRAAVQAVVNGFADQDRGKMIMACGTGKTFTSLRVAEAMVKPGGSVLFLVPSISLMSQTYREWTIEADVPLRPFAVCSDTKVGKKTDNEDIAPYDLVIPSTTNAKRLVEHFKGESSASSITVVFSTYQSLSVVAEAQLLGLPDFDLVICDEAHRTTGVTLSGEDESNFVRIHDQSYLKAKRRLYMTATPRIYDDTSKTQAEQGSAVIASMDDPSLYGPEFYWLGFGEAVSKGLLSDYKVLVLAVDESSVSRTFQAQLSNADNELQLDDAAKIVGCWNGLAKRGYSEFGFGNDLEPMHRAVAFSRSIRDSQKFARLFQEIVDQYVGINGLTLDDEDEPTSDIVLDCEVEHVDGTFNVLRRNEKLDWLKARLNPDECRVLSNARCLSEGVDVPALDAVMFLNPRNSVVDVVQSVGRVMRKAPGKQYGYVILPIGIPADMTPEQALADNQKYKVVWEVLQALRAHDERFNAMVNQIELNKAKPDTIQVIGVGDFRDPDAKPANIKGVQTTLAFPDLGEWRDAIYARIVKKVGDRRYWEDWAKDVADIAERHTTRIKALLDDPSLDLGQQFDEFLTGLKANLNDSISREDAIDMLSQHLITKPVFDALFDDYSFAEHNPVSLVMQRMLDALDDHGLDKETETLDKFYASVRLRAKGIDNAEGKQKIITELYEKFFRIAFPRAAESLGIVYTPVEIVDFIIRSVDAILKDEFGASISDPGVHVLDPFTGTGTFIVRLLQSGLISPEHLLYKYTNDLHANEILLLAYYIAAINIEATFHDVNGGDYRPFDGVVLTDTFQIAEDGDTMDEFMFPDNNERVAQQKSLDIRVIIGNPPYSSGQSTQNDNNKNLKYPTLDASIANTYVARSSATLKNSLYDSYIRAIRWASNRIGQSADGGVIGFVTNGGYIDSNTADGLRKTLIDEFSGIYVYNLRGNSRNAGDIAKKEGGNVFNVRVGVAILLLVKKPNHAGPALLQYRDIGDYLSRDEKLSKLDKSELTSLGWDRITPNEAGDWINQRNETFATYVPLGSKDSSEPAIFNMYTSGLKTNRDAWNYGFSVRRVEANVRRMVDFFNSEADRFDLYCSINGVKDRKDLVESFVDRDPKKFSWDRSDKARIVRGYRHNFDHSAMTVASYRPFTKEWVYFDAALNNTVYKLPALFPSIDDRAVGFVMTGVGAAMEFTVLAVDHVPDMSSFGGQTNALFFPLESFEVVGGRADLFQDDESTTLHRLNNVSPVMLAIFQASYGDDVSSQDIFYYAYGVLHSPTYRATYASDLKKTLPRIPLVPDDHAFRSFVDAGRKLATLHVNYEAAEPYALEEVTPQVPDFVEPAFHRVQKMSFGKVGKSVDRSRIVYNSHVTLAGIPLRAYDYMLGSKSAIEWIMERYQVKADKDSGIVNDPNDWCDEVGNPRYIIDLIKRIVTVSIETVKIVDGLPPLDL